MSAYQKFQQFVEDINEKKHDLSSDQLKIALTNIAPSSNDVNLTDLTEIDYSNCSAREIATSSSGQTGGVYKLVVNDITLSASGGSVGPFRYVVVYNDDNDKLIAFADYGSSITLNDGESILVDFDGVDGLYTLQ